MLFTLVPFIVFNILVTFDDDIFYLETSVQLCVMYHRVCSTCSKQLSTFSFVGTRAESSVAE